MKQKKTLKIHDKYVSFVKQMTPIVLDASKFDSEMDSEKPFYDLDLNELYIYKFNDNYSESYIGIEELNSIFKIKGEHTDGYGTVIVSKDEMVLSNYDFYPDEPNESYTHIIGFCTIYKRIVRYTQIVYSFKINKIIVRENQYYKLPKSAKTAEIGSKRCIGKYNNILRVDKFILNQEIFVNS